MNIGMRIDIIEEDIFYGAQGELSLLECPLALAIRRTFNLDSECKVLVEYPPVLITIDTPNSQHKFTAPARVKVFLSQFDAGIKVKPISFYLQAL